MNRLFRTIRRGWSWGGVTLTDSLLAAATSGWSWGGVTSK